ncbi:MAG TPA: DUF4168 domain-containing protein [Oscillatoriaceae cyanobacterium M33_DOE_052]|uniref:DUF4168 domain-containing protein n=1 Tax=Planktothricoides sp. SpSt-374 TaxID=2282167 RepID=A0A7C3VGU9_9CYAN|nr:DUF4168 domain-containing protein [Oscillatoriaceae cyanobacterium M33_DOE_052]
MNVKHSSLSRQKILSTSLIAGVVSGFSLLFGAVPSLVIPTVTAPASATFTLDISTAASAQETFSSGEITNYARSLLKIEPLRQNIFNQIKQMLGASAVPNIVCNDLTSPNQLNGQARDIAEDYCQQSKQIVESNGLTIRRFNEITRALNNDPLLQMRILQELIRLQAIPGLP